MKLNVLNAAIVAGLGAAFQQETEAATRTSGGNAKTPRFASKDWDDAFESAENQKLVISFSNGETVEFDGALVEDELTRHRLFMHGASQKIGDSYASVKGDHKQAKANAEEVINLLYSGEWTGEREGGGPRLAELAEAIAKIKGVDVERARAAVEAATKEERETWRSNAKVKATVAQIRAERAAANLEKVGEQELNVRFGR